MKSILKTCTALTMVATFTGQVAAQEMLQSLGAGEGEVSIVAWAGYIERGETDPNYDWVTKFEADSGCKVTVKTANTSDEMVALMNEGGFDLVTASGDASLRLIAGKRVQPINTALIPSWSSIDERLQNAAWHTVDGTHYGTPYVWGANVLMYNTDVFGDKPPTSWNVVFEEMELPDGVECQIRPRSGLALRPGLTLPNSPATIDPDYRGELRVIVWNAGADAVPIPRGMRVAQLVFARFECPEVQAAEVLGGTARGSGGFGSTGG